MVKEGTCFVRVGWDKQTTTKTEIIPAGIPPEMVQKLYAKGAEIEEMKDGQLKVTITDILKNRPTAKPLRLEDVYFDPTADSFEEIQFFAFDYVTTLSDLKRQPDLYDEAAVNKLAKILDQQSDIQQGSYEESHQYNRYAFESTENTRKKIRLTEYWGEFDLDDTGINVPAMATLARFGDDKVILKMEKNKLPFKEKPFICMPLIEKEFAIYGDALASMITDEQNFMTSIVRGIVDNMSASNNGTKFVRKNALDSTNFQRMMDNERVVEVNTNEAISSVIMDASFNQLPSDVYNTLSMIEQQSESLTGVSKMMQGISSTEMKASSANFSAVMSQSQIRLLDMTTSLTNGLRKMFYMWISMSSDYLSEEEIQNITGVYIPELKVKETKRIMAELHVEELPPESKQKAMDLVIREVQDMFDKNDLKYDVKMKVGTDGLKDIKIAQINMLMQQVTGLSQMGIVDPNMAKGLLADMMDAMDRPDLAKMAIEYQPQPDPMQQAMGEAELNKTKSEATKNNALAGNAAGRTRNEQLEAENTERNRGIETEGKAIDNAAKAAKIGQDETKTNADAYSKVKQAQEPKMPKAKV